MIIIGLFCQISDKLRNLIKEHILPIDTILRKLLQHSIGPDAMFTAHSLPELKANYTLVNSISRTLIPTLARLDRNHFSWHCDNGKYLN